MLFLTFGLALCPGLAAFMAWRGPRVAVGAQLEPPDVSLAEAAVLRDGAVGATRWAFAALVVTLARDGHCTLVRTRKRRWVRSRPVLTVDLHADPTALSPFEHTVVRQLGRHDTLNGFGFAGSTFRRRTLRDVRADLVERGWLLDRHRRSNACLALGLVLVGIGLVAGLSLLTGATSIGLGVGSLLAALPRYPVTKAGARRRASHRAYAESQHDQIRTHLSDAPARASAQLLDVLPHLILERIATPRWLGALADRLETADVGPPPDWIRSETDKRSSFADGCRLIGNTLTALGARPVRDRFR